MSENIVEGSAVRRLERSRSDRMLAGVCGGLARYFGINAAFYRVGFVVLTILGGASILMYVAAVLVIPDEGKEESVAATVLRERRGRPWPLVGLALVAVGTTVLLSHITFWPHGDAAWFLLLAAGALILWVTHHRQERSAPAPASASLDEDTAARAAQDAYAVNRLFATIAIGLLSFVSLLLIVGAIFASIFHVRVWNGVGERNYAATDVSHLNRNYKLGIGSMTLDLRHLRLPLGETDVRARVDVGNLRVLVPANVALQATAEADAGRVELLGTEGDGRDVNRSVTEPGARQLVVDAHVGLGSVHVIRAVR
jgi:phage shock protein C